MGGLIVPEAAAGDASLANGGEVVGLDLGVFQVVDGPVEHQAAVRGSTGRAIVDADEIVRPRIAAGRDRLLLGSIRDLHYPEAVGRDVPEDFEKKGPDGL